jgi:very-short-patch-repair endonuclease
MAKSLSGEGVKMKSEKGAALAPLAQSPSQNTTPTEDYLWQRLRGKRFEGMKFGRQQPVGNYTVAFVSLEKKLIVELDGGQHAGNKLDDQARDQWLKAQGFSVLRFWNNEVMSNVEGVLKTIQRQVSHPPQ